MPIAYTVNVRITNTLTLIEPEFCTPGQVIGITTAMQARLDEYDDLAVFNHPGGVNSNFGGMPDFDPDHNLASSGSLIRVGFGHSGRLFPIALLDPVLVNGILDDFAFESSNPFLTSLSWNVLGNVGTGTEFSSKSQFQNMIVRGINQIIFRDMLVEYDVVVKDDGDDPPTDATDIPLDEQLYEAHLVPIVDPDITYNQSGDFDLLSDDTISSICGSVFTGDHSTNFAFFGSDPIIGTYAGMLHHIYDIGGVFNPNLE